MADKLIVNLSKALLLGCIMILASCGNNTQSNNNTSTPSVGDTAKPVDMPSAEPQTETRPEVKPEPTEQTWHNQKLKQGEQIVTVKWGTQKTIGMSRDFHGGHYASNNLTVPSGKKWILLYINEDYTYASGNVISTVPKLAHNNEVKEFHNRIYSNQNNINLSQAKDENMKFYAGTKLIGLSSREKGDRSYGNCTDYAGEMWFYEIND